MIEVCHYQTTAYYNTHKSECIRTGSVPKCFKRICTGKRDAMPAEETSSKECRYQTTPYYNTHKTECIRTGSVPKCFKRICTGKRDALPDQNAGLEITEADASNKKCRYQTTPYYNTHKTECIRTGSVPKCFKRICTGKRDAMPEADDPSALELAEREEAQYCQYYATPYFQTHQAECKRTKSVPKCFVQRCNGKRDALPEAPESPNVDAANVSAEELAALEERDDQD
ncbi:MAG: hypothetical protein Q9219_007388, partial [cf. Caloplaca sp. 3 TL-2023]